MQQKSEMPTLPEPPPIDAQRLADLCALASEDEEDLLGRLIQIFLEDAPQALVDLRNALANADARAVARLAHTVRGSSAYFGAYRLQELCNAIETAGRTGDLTPVSALITSASSELRRVIVALEAHLQLPPT